MRKLNLCGFVLVLAVGVTGTAFAGNGDRVGTAGAQELRIPVSPRGVALGDGYQADVSGVDALWYNPAGAARLDGTEAYFSHFEYIADIQKEYIAVATETRMGTIGASIDVLNIGDIQETTEANPEGTGRIFSPTFTVIGVTYSRFMTDAVSVGATGRFISEDILQTTSQGVSFDVGIQYRPGWQSLRLGFVLKNFGPNMHFDGEDFGSSHQTGDDPNSRPRVLRSDNASFELPSVFQIAAAYTPIEQGDNTIDVYGNFVSHNFGDDEFGVGGEYRYQDIFAVRAGIVASGDADYNYGPAFGAGFNLPLGTSTLSIDYARRTVQDFFDDNDLLSVKFAF